jgi:hypothetical protein
LLETASVQNLTVKAYPNPSSSYFNVSIQGSLDQPISMNIIDVSGRILETKTGISANSTIQIGQRLPLGIYLLQIIQGKQKTEMKVIKQ